MSNNEENFTSFHCPACNTEIEATLDMIGQSTECPACGVKITIPDNRGDDVVRHGPNNSDTVRTQAMKSRTIRIELDDDL